MKLNNIPYMDLMGIWTIYLVAKSTDPCETIIQGPKWQLVSNSSDLLFGDVDPHLLSTHLFNHWVQITMSKGKIGHGTFFQPSGSEGEDVAYCLLNFHHPVGGQPLEKPSKSLRCWDQDDLEWMELGRTYLELAWKLISFGGMCWCDCRHSCRCWFCSNMMIMTSWNLPGSKAKSGDSSEVEGEDSLGFCLTEKNAIITREDTLKALKVTQV